MRHLGKLLLFILLSVNLLFTGMLLLTAYCPHLHPTAHPWLSSLGLTFPLFLVINVLFLLFWLIFQQYKAALLPLVGLLCCYSAIHTLFPLRFSTPEAPEGSIQLLSYNIMGFDGCRKKEGHNLLLDYLVHSGADILCLQEYATATDGKRHLTQQDVERALKAYPYHRITSVGNSKGTNNQLACYSKFPILSATPLTLNSSYNGAVAYRLKVGNDTLLLINNHLESNKLTKQDKVVYEELLTVPEKEKMKSGLRHLLTKLAEASTIRASQADSIAARLKQSSLSYRVVCGDFNDIPLSYTYRTIAQGLNDAFACSGQGAGISYNQNHFYFRIDHILTGKSIAPYRCFVDRSIKESDHYPIRCHLVLEKAREM